MRIGLVIGQLTAGGAEGQLCLLCRELTRRSAITPFVYCLSDRTEPHGPHLDAIGVSVRVVTGHPLVRLRALRRRLAADRIDVVHAWLFVANAYAWLATRGSRPLVTSARNCKQHGWLLDTLNRRAFAASAAILANSQQVAQYIRDVYEAPPDRIQMIHNAIDTEHFRPTTETHPRDLCVVMIGRLVPQKNPGLFVAAASEVRRQLPSVRFRIIGEGPLRPTVEAAIAASGLNGCCEILGERRDVAELLRAADLLWLTSDWEGLPNVVLEAMASGVPVVATDVGGTRELVQDGENGFVIPAGDRDALVARSLSLLRDAARRRQFGIAARARAESLSPGRMADAIEDVYRRVHGVLA